MVSKRIIPLSSILLASVLAGQAIATPQLSSLRVNSGTGGTAASYHWVIPDPVYPQDYWETASMSWSLGAAGANCSDGPSWASLEVSFWNLTPDHNYGGGWAEFGNPATIEGSASSTAVGWSYARSWANISFTNTTTFLFSARVTGNASVSLRGGASFDIVNGQSLDIWLSAGDYSISLDTNDGGSFFATIPAPGTLMLGAAGAMLLVPRRRRALN